MLPLVGLWTKLVWTLINSIKDLDSWYTHDSSCDQRFGRVTDHMCQKYIAMVRNRAAINDLIPVINCSGNRESYEVPLPENDGNL